MKIAGAALENFDMKLLDFQKSSLARSRKFGFYFLIWVVSALAFAANPYRLISHYENFVSSGIPTEGKVTGTSIEEFSDSISYTYKVHGVQFNGTGPGKYANPTIVDLKPGDNVLVFYDRNNINSSVSGKPELLVAYQIRHTWFSGLLGSTMIVILILIAKSGLSYIRKNGIGTSEGT